MNARELNRRITIERAEITGVDAFGHPVRGWKSFKTLWAKKTDVSDGERWRAQELAASVTTRFIVRYGSGVTPTDRIVYDGRVYEITGVKELEGRRQWEEITTAARAD